MQATVFHTGLNNADEFPPEQGSTSTAVNLESALSRLGEYVIACCVSFPSDEELDQRLRSQCATLESSLAPGDRGRWNAERDSLLVRLGCRPWSY